MSLPVYAALLGAFVIIMQVVLMMRVGFYRTKGVFVGLGDDPVLERLVRRHGNLAENSGIFIAVFALLEMITGQTTYVAVVCIVFAVCRVAHAIGFSSQAGSHGENLQGANRFFAAMRVLGGLGTAGTAFAAGVAIFVHLL